MISLGVAIKPANGSDDISLEAIPVLILDRRFGGGASRKIRVAR